MMTWTKEADGSLISADGRFLLHKRPDRHYDVVPADGRGKANKQRLSLTAAKELAEQLACGSTEGDYWHLPVVKDCTGQPLPSETLAQLHDQGDVGSIPVGSLTAGMRAILSPTAEQRTKKAQVERPAAEQSELGIVPVGKPLIEVLANESTPAKAKPTKAQKAKLNRLADKHADKVQKTKLRGGIGSEPKAEAPPPAPVLTPTQVQAKLDELVWRHGSNIAEWLDYPKLLADAGLHPEQVTDLVMERAAESAKERQTREAKQTDGPKEYRLGNLYIGACVQVAVFANGLVPGSKAEIVANNDSEIKVKVIDEQGKQSTQHWSPGTMVRVLSRDEFKARKPAEPLTTPDNEPTIAESPETETPEDAEEITVMQVKHADAVALLKTWYPTADGFNAKKTEAKLRSLPERLASDPEAERPADKHAVKLLETIIAAADAGDEIEVAMNGDGASEMDGAVVVRKVAKNGNGKHAAAPKAAKAEKKPAKAGKAATGKKGEPREGSITHLILTSLQKGPTSKDGIVKVLVKKFPDHKPDTLKNTVAWNIATGLPRKGYKVKKDAEGLFSV